MSLNVLQYSPSQVFPRPKILSSVHGTSSNQNKTFFQKHMSYGYQLTNQQLWIWLGRKDTHFIVQLLNWFYGPQNCAKQQKAKLSITLTSWGRVIWTHNVQGSYKSILKQFWSFKLYQNTSINQTFFGENTPSQISKGVSIHSNTSTYTDSTLQHIYSFTHNTGS